MTDKLEIHRWNRKLQRLDACLRAEVGFGFKVFIRSSDDMGLTVNEMRLRLNVLVKRHLCVNTVSTMYRYMREARETDECQTQTT